MAAVVEWVGLKWTPNDVLAQRANQTSTVRGVT